MAALVPEPVSWAEAARVMAGAVDALAHVPAAYLADTELSQALEHVAVQASRLHAIAVTVVAEADARRTWKKEGATSLRGWVRRCVQLADDAARLVTAARMVPFMPRMAALFSAGNVSLAQMGTAARQVQRLPCHPAWPQPGDAPGTAQSAQPGDGTSPHDSPGGFGTANVATTDTAADYLADAEAKRDGGNHCMDPATWGDVRSAADDIIAHYACAADARALATLGEHIYAAADPGGHLGETLSRHERRHLSISRSFEGMGEIAGRLDPEATERAITVLAALSKRAGPDDHRTAGQRRADAFDLLCTNWLGSGELPPAKDGKSRRAQVIVTIPYGTLTGLRGAATAVLGSNGTPISADTARRLACDAPVRRIVLGPSGPCAEPSGAEPAHLDQGNPAPDSADADARRLGETRPERDSANTAGVHADGIEAAHADTSGVYAGDARTGRRLRHIDRGRGDPHAPPRTSTGRDRTDPTWRDRTDPTGREADGARPGGVSAVDPAAKLVAMLRAGIAALPPPLGTPSAVLDAGRSTPTFTQPMRDALHARYGGRCSFSRCNRSATVDHHIVHWSQGGPTSVANGAPLCEYHHYLVHEGGWRLHKDPGGNIAAIPPPSTWPGPRIHWRRGHQIAGAPPHLRRFDGQPRSPNGQPGPPDGQPERPDGQPGPPDG